MSAPAYDTGAVERFLDTHADELIAFRRWLHAHPEPSYREHETTALVAARLEAARLSPRRLSAGTGLICDVPPGSPPTVALRADLDALCTLDEKDAPYRSQVPGVAHACGHDVHTTIVLGAGLALAGIIGEFGEPGPHSGVRLLFQPAEEAVPGGALDVIADGGLEGVHMIFGLHCDPKLDVGRVGVRAGPITSSADMVEIRLRGAGGHTARPALTADLVAVAGRVAAELPARVRDRDGALQLVFGAVHAGDAANVIPSLALLRGTVRTPDRAAWGGAPALVESVLAELVARLAVSYELEYVQGPPPVENDPAATELLALAARRALGGEAVLPTAQSAGGDDFSWYLERVAGSYARLGVRDPAADEATLDLHASTFDVDERSIAVGVRLLVCVALEALAATP